MTDYLDNLVAKGVITVETIDGKQVVRLTQSAMDRMMTPAPLTGKAAEHLEKMVRKYGK
ncbi:hypothetical protein [Polynucleobacter sp.]|uniref:hypothetical protein n=1 Tax=Polynucleobacter sp. TaxID=2029855 RepID=UPI003F69DB4D